MYTKQKICRIVPIIAFLFLFVLPYKHLNAQMICSGSACSALPISNQQLDEVFSALRFQYFDEVLKDMSNAMVYSGMHISPSGVVNLREFTIGAALTASTTKARKLDVYVPSYGTLTDMPSAGISVVPKLFVGFNLGYLFSGEPYNWYVLDRFGLHRFDFYISGLNLSLNEMQKYAKPKKDEQYGGFSKSIAAELRYHLVEGGDREAAFFSFSGVSLGLGYNRIEQKLSYTRSKSKVKLNAGSGTTIVWDGQDNILYHSKMDVVPVSIRTGIQFLYLLRLSVGGGVAFSKGSSELELSRFGRAYANNDLAALLGLNLPDAYLSLALKGSGGPSSPRNAFATVGLEINIPFVKLFVDAAGDQKNYSANVGVRFVF